MEEEQKSQNEPAVIAKRHWFHTVVLWSLGGSVFLIAAACFVAWFYTVIYSGRVYPGVQIGGYDVGGLTRSGVKTFIENINNRYAKEGISLTIVNATRGDNEAVLPTIGGGDSAVEAISLNSDAISDAAIAAGRKGEWWQQYVSPLWYRLQPVALSVPVKVNQDILISVLQNTLHPWEDDFHDAQIEVTRVSTGEAKVIPEVGGQTFNYDEIARAVSSNIAKLSFAPVAVSLNQLTPTITSKDIYPLLPELQKVLNESQLWLVANSSTIPGYAWDTTWELMPYDLAQMITVEKNSNDMAVFTLAKEKVFHYFDTMIRPEVDVAPVDAKFTIENNKMKEFQASKSGRQLNAEAVFRVLKSVFEAQQKAVASTTVIAVPVVVDITAPAIKTADIEGMGITQIIGVGTSTFKDSHSNRIKNIANAVKRLNGVIIAPGEIFSSNKYAGPYTPENGFLPEQIIKGQEIKDEVGGGMCQIGTTLFRMAMQTGLPITERHNHSLVVGYYADPVNGNPGTDATLYEPTLDLRFENDTGHYMLLLTEISYSRQMLTFTLWGMPDGRSGWYTHPKVSKWIPPPPDTQYIAQTDGKLEVGKMKCQSAFKGAMASFTYHRVTPDGEKIDLVYDSYYRPLPKICTVGVDPLDCPKGKPCTITSSTLPVAFPSVVR